MKKFMLMAATVLVTLAANAQTSPEAKAIKKMKTLEEVQAAYNAQGASLSTEDKAFVLNKIAEIAAKDAVSAGEAALKAQMAKDEATQTAEAAKEALLSYTALSAANECYQLNPKAMKIGDKLMSLRATMVNAGLNAYNTKNYADAQKYFGFYVDAPKNPLFGKADFSTEKGLGQVAYYAALASYFNKDSKKANDYADMSLASGETEVLNDALTMKLGALEEMAKAAIIDTTQYINDVKKLYESHKDNETIFGKLVGLCDESGDKAGAKSLLDARLAENPNDAMANAYVGQGAQSEEKYAEAIAAYEKALVAKPDFIYVKLNLGVCYLNKAAKSIDANTDARGNIKPESKDGIVAELNKAKSILEEVKAADPDRLQVNWSYPLERVQYALDNIQ